MKEVKVPDGKYFETNVRPTLTCTPDPTQHVASVAAR